MPTSAKREGEAGTVMQMRAMWGPDTRGIDKRTWDACAEWGIGSSVPHRFSYQCRVPLGARAGIRGSSACMMWVACCKKDRAWARHRRGITEPTGSQRCS